MIYYEVAVVNAPSTPLPCNDYFFVSVVVVPPPCFTRLGPVTNLSPTLEGLTGFWGTSYTAGSGGSTTSSMSGGSVTADSWLNRESPSLEQSNQLTNFAGGGLILSPAMEPIPPCLVQRILSGQFIHMRELLSDNMALYQQWEGTQGVVDVASLYLQVSIHITWRSHPSPCEYSASSPIAAVCAPDEASQNLLIYCQLLIREALRHGEEQWREYNRLFHSQAAINPLVSWNTICASLQAATLLGQVGLSAHSAMAQIIPLNHVPSGHGNRLHLECCHQHLAHPR